MGSRRPNPRLAKIHLSYSVEEMAGLFNVHKNTIRAWFKQGLKAIDDKRPTMARGEEIRRFLGERRARANGPLVPVESTACRAASRRSPLGGWPSA